MTNVRAIPYVAFAVALAFGLMGNSALGQSPVQLKAHAVSFQTAKADPQTAPALFQLSQGFGVLPPVDGSGFDEWPCFGGMTDCSTIAAGGVVIGTPSYTWSLANCDASQSNSAACGQIFWFYEDDTGDSTDHLIVSITGKQGTNYVLDTGNYDFGPNPYADQVTVIAGDLAFGTLGQTGKGNGLCRHSNKTCVNPVAGLVDITVTTTVGPSHIKSSFKVNLK